MESVAACPYRIKDAVKGYTVSYSKVGDSILLRRADSEELIGCVLCSAFEPFLQPASSMFQFFCDAIGE